ncbi:MAG: metal-dependent transcriptional regulator [Candidatus Bathyarchaeia archaeon]
MSTEAMENYLEAIYLLTKRKQRVRISDISSALKVKAPTATEMVQRLADRGLVTYKPYKRNIQLTAEGEVEAVKVMKKHNILKGFLQLLGVSEEIAEEDACKIEHHIHHETMNRLSKFIEFIQIHPESPKLLESFRSFCCEK